MIDNPKKSYRGKKLTNPDLKEIRRLASVPHPFKPGKKKYSHGVLADMYGVSRPRITQIVNSPSGSRGVSTEPPSSKLVQKRMEEMEIATIENLEQAGQFGILWMDALSKADLMPALVRLQRGDNLSDDEKKNLRESGKVFSQFLTSLDRSGQLQIQLGVQVDVQLEQLSDKLMGFVYSAIQEFDNSEEIFNRIVAYIERQEGGDVIDVEGELIE